MTRKLQYMLPLTFGKRSLKQVGAGDTYSLLGTYASLALDFMPREGRSMRKAPCVEIYLTAPERTPPAELLTEVLVPVR